jgi:hypothetical protein
MGLLCSSNLLRTLTNSLFIGLQTVLPLAAFQFHLFSLQTVAEVSIWKTESVALVVHTYRKKKGILKNRF